MLVLKKKEIVAAALVVMIGVAGYLNWSYQDTVRVTDSKSYQKAGKTLGEAQYVDKKVTGISKNTSDDSYFSQAKLEKDNARSKALEILKTTAENENFDEETRKNAQDRILKMASDTEKETVIENVCKAKGYDMVSVYIDGENADIIIKKDDFSEKDVNVLKEIVTGQLKIGAENIKIVEMS